MAARKPQGKTLGVAPTKQKAAPPTADVFGLKDPKTGKVIVGGTKSTVEGVIAEHKTAPANEALRRQQILRAAGFRVALDGVWGPRTQQAWNQYMTKKGGGSVVLRPGVRAKNMQNLPSAKAGTSDSPNMITPEMIRARNAEEKRKRDDANRRAMVHDREIILVRDKALSQNPALARDLTLHQLSMVLGDKETKLRVYDDGPGTLAFQNWANAHGSRIPITGKYDTRTSSLVHRLEAKARKKAEQGRLWEIRRRVYTPHGVGPETPPGWWPYKEKFPTPRELDEMIQGSIGRDENGHLTGKNNTSDIMKIDLIYKNSFTAQDGFDAFKHAAILKKARELQPFGFTAQLFNLLGDKQGANAVPTWMAYLDIMGITDLSKLPDTSGLDPALDARYGNRKWALDKHAKNPKVRLANQQALGGLHGETNALFMATDAKDFSVKLKAYLRLEEKKSNDFQKKLAGESLAWWGKGINAAFSLGDNLRTATVLEMVRAMQFYGNGFQVPKDSDQITFEDAQHIMGYGAEDYAGPATTANRWERLILELTYDPLNVLHPFRYTSNAIRYLRSAEQMGHYAVTDTAKFVGLQRDLKWATIGSKRFSYQKGTWDIHEGIEKWTGGRIKRAPTDPSFIRRSTIIMRDQAVMTARGGVVDSLRHGFIPKPGLMIKAIKGKKGKALLEKYRPELIKQLETMPETDSFVADVKESMTSFYENRSRKGNPSQIGASWLAFHSEESRIAMVHSMAVQRGQRIYDRATQILADDTITFTPEEVTKIKDDAAQAAFDSFAQLVGDAGVYSAGIGIIDTAAEDAAERRLIQKEIARRHALMRSYLRDSVMPALQDIVEAHAENVYKAEVVNAQKAFAKGIDMEKVVHPLWDETDAWIGGRGELSQNLRKLAAEQFDEKNMIPVDNPQFGYEWEFQDFSELADNEIDIRMSRLQWYVSRHGKSGLNDLNESFDFHAAAEEIRQTVVKFWHELPNGKWIDTRPQIKAPPMYIKHSLGAFGSSKSDLFNFTGQNVATTAEERMRFLAAPPGSYAHAGMDLGNEARGLTWAMGMQVTGKLPWKRIAVSDAVKRSPFVYEKPQKDQAGLKIGDPGYHNPNEGRITHEVTPVAKQDAKTRGAAMDKYVAEMISKYRDLEQKAAAGEKRVEATYGIADLVEKPLDYNHWQEWSRARGYTEQEISDFEEWLALNKELGITEPDHAGTDAEPFGVLDSSLKRYAQDHWLSKNKNVSPPVATGKAQWHNNDFKLQMDATFDRWGKFQDTLAHHQLGLSMGYDEQIPGELLKQGAAMQAWKNSQSWYLKGAYRAVVGTLNTWRFATLPLRMGWAVRNIIDNTAKVLLAGMYDPRYWFLGAENPGAATKSIFDQVTFTHLRHLILFCDDLFGSDMITHWMKIERQFWSVTGDVLKSVFNAHGLEKVPDEVLHGSRLDLFDIESSRAFANRPIHSHKMIRKHYKDLVDQVGEHRNQIEDMRIALAKLPENTDKYKQARQFLESFEGSINLNAPAEYAESVGLKHETIWNKKHGMKKEKDDLGRTVLDPETGDPVMREVSHFDSFRNGVWEMMGEAPEKYYKRVLYHFQLDLAERRMIAEGAHLKHLPLIDIGIKFDGQAFRQLAERELGKEVADQMEVVVQYVDASEYGVKGISRGEASYDAHTGMPDGITIRIPRNARVRTQAEGDALVEQVVRTSLHELRHQVQNIQKTQPVWMRRLDRKLPYKMRLREKDARMYSDRNTRWHVGLGSFTSEETLPLTGYDRHAIRVAAHDEAWALVEKTLFDYTKITTGEDNLKVFFPFIQFWRKNTALWVEHFVQKPWLDNAALQLDRARQDAHKDEPLWMQRYFSKEEITDLAGRVPGFAPIASALIPDGVQYDPVNFFSFAPFFRAYKTAFYGESQSVKPDEENANGNMMLKFVRGLIDGMSDYGLGMSPFARKPLEHWGIANARSWQFMFPQTGPLVALSNKFFNEELALTVADWERVFTLMQGDKPSDEIAANLEYFTRQEMAGQAARGEPLDKARAEKVIKAWFWTQNAYAYVTGTYLRRATPEDVTLATVWNDILLGRTDQADLSPEMARAINLWKIRGWDDLTFDSYVSLIPIIEAYYKSPTWQEKDDLKTKYPEITRWVDAAYRGKPFSGTWIQNGVQQIDKARYHLALGFSDGADVPYEVRQAALEMFVTPQLQKYWDSFKTDKDLQDHMTSMEAHASYKKTMDAYMDLPATDYDAKDSFIKDHPELVRYWNRNNDHVDDLSALWHNANGALRDIYFSIKDAKGWDAAAGFLKAHPFMFEHTKSAKKIRNGEWIGGFKGGSHMSAAHAAAYRAIKPQLKWFFDVYMKQVGEKAAWGWLQDNNGDVATAIKAYFKAWGKHSQKQIDYLRAQKWLSIFFNLPHDQQDAWLNGGSDGAKLVKDFFAKYGTGGGEHARDYIAAKDALAFYFDMSKSERKAWLASGSPDAAVVLAYFKKYGKAHQQERSFLKKYPGMENGTPEQAARLDFWRQYFSLTPDKRPAFIHDNAEASGVYVYGAFGEQQAKEREAEYDRRALGLGLSQTQADYLYVKPMLDFMETLPANEKVLFKLANPEIDAYYAQHPFTGSQTGNPATDKMIEAYFKLDAHSDARTQYIKDHPDLQAWFDERSTPAEKAIHSVLTVFFSIPQGLERKKYGAAHPEIKAYFDAKRLADKLLSNQYNALNDNDPRLKGYYKDAADMERAAKAMRDKLAAQAAGIIDNIPVAHGDRVFDKKSVAKARGA